MSRPLPVVRPNGIRTTHTPHTAFSEWFGPLLVLDLQADGTPDEAEVLSEFELARLENIKRNARVLAEMGLGEQYVYTVP